MERNIRNLPPAFQQEIHKAQKELTHHVSHDAQPKFADFHVNGRDHKAYYVPQEEPRGRTTYLFECLVY